MLIRIQRRIFYCCVFTIHSCVNAAIIGINAGIFKIPTAVTALYLEIDLYGVGLTTDKICVSTTLYTHLSVVALFVPTKPYYLIGHMVLGFNRRKAKVYGFARARFRKC